VGVAAPGRSATLARASLCVSRATRRSIRARRRSRRSRRRTRRIRRAPSSGAMSPRASARQTLPATRWASSGVRADMMSMRSRLAGSIARSGVSTGARSGRSRFGLRSSRADAACGLARQARSVSTRRCGFGTPRGRPPGIAGMPLGKAPAPVPRLAPLAYARPRETRKDQDHLIEIPGFRFQKTGANRSDQARRQRFPASGALDATWKPQNICSCYVQPTASGSGGPRSSGEAMQDESRRPTGFAALNQSRR